MFLGPGHRLELSADRADRGPSAEGTARVNLPGNRDGRRRRRASQSSADSDEGFHDEPSADDSPHDSPDILAPPQRWGASLRASKWAWLEAGEQSMVANVTMQYRQLTVGPCARGASMRVKDLREIVMAIGCPDLVELNSTRVRLAKRAIVRPQALERGSRGN
eukprot:TRINITY_DN5174_c1_g2_i1.p2 TRINITY_DN5174_c1_g2~~TRINITY_DN5174_c1_g2_i1.p2  ORF type:complete len:163 (+),score=9.52 TRINITY_DN5174_c1_g2_i1:142-630(+)